MGPGNRDRNEKSSNNTLNCNRNDEYYSQARSWNDRGQFEKSGSNALRPIDDGIETEEQIKFSDSPSKFGEEKRSISGSRKIRDSRGRSNAVDSGTNKSNFNDDPTQERTSTKQVKFSYSLFVISCSK